MSALWLTLLLVLGGPRETVAGKYIQHTDEYWAVRGGRPKPLELARMPMAADYSRLIERNGPSAESFASLGTALMREGEKELAFRAFDRAALLGHPDLAWIERQKDECPRVPPSVLKRERAEAKLWVGYHQQYERARLREGLDPDDLTEFYARFGRPEEDMAETIRNRRLSFLAGVAGILIGIAFAAASRALRRPLALVPLLVAVLLFVGPGLLGQAGLLGWGAGFSAAGAIFVFLFGKTVVNNPG